MSLLESPGHASRDRGIFLDQVLESDPKLRTGSAPILLRRRQESALNLSAKRRLCSTVGRRFIDGTPRCCAVSSALSRAVATTNFARSNQSLVLRALFAETKRCSLVNIFMICPPVGW
jgi:hypothetical protein